MSEDAETLRAEIAQLSARLAAIAAKSQGAAGEFWSRRGKEVAGEEFSLIDAPGVAQAFGRFGAEIMGEPERYLRAQAKLLRRQLALTNATLARLEGARPEPVAEPAPGDRRFKDKAWSDDAVFDYLKQSYLIASDFVNGVVDDARTVDRQTKKKVAFYTRQFVSAASPSNYAATNPEVLRAARETKGENLVKGLEQLLSDMERGAGRLDIKRSRGDAFELGKNIATSEGAVVFENALFQLIHYEPTQKRVRKRPLLVAPPWINKFYVLDLQPKNSFVRFALDQGFDVFMMSWVNPGLEHKDFGLDAYLRLGPLAALDAVREQTGEPRCDVLGFCIGGILTQILLAWLAAKGDDRVASATLLAAMVDFSEVGETQVFIDEDQVERIEEYVEKKGYLEGQHMADMFSMMRENDLIWSFVVNNYLMGREPMPFDLLHWNADSTRMPAKMLVEYLRKIYLDNSLGDRGRLEIAGEKIDLGRVRTPIYSVATREDHIAPWRACHPITQKTAGPVTFVLAGSGHIAGVVNPPGRDKYGFVATERAPADPDALPGPEAGQKGSWWPHWAAWLDNQAKTKVAATKRGPRNGALPMLEPAPGSFVRG